MKDYGQYCPVSLGSEVLADRWTPLIMRELLLGSTRFNDIERCLPGISRTLLSQRLRHLARKGVVRLVPAAGGRGHEYHLTDAGRELEPVIMGLGEWAARHLYREPEPAEVDPVTLTWWLHHRLDPDHVPEGRVVVELRFTGADPVVLWLVIDRGEPSVCMKHPGFDSDLVVVTTALDMSRVFNGIESLRDAMGRGAVQILGPPRLARGFGRWFLWSPFAATVREVVTEQARRAGGGRAAPSAAAP